MQKKIRPLFFLIISLFAANGVAQTVTDSLIGSWKVAYHASAAGRSAPNDTTLIASFYAEGLYQDYDYKRVTYEARTGSSVERGSKKQVVFHAIWSMRNGEINLMNCHYPWDNPKKLRNPNKNITMRLVSVSRDSLVLEAVEKPRRKHKRGPYTSQTHYYRVADFPKQEMRFDEYEQQRYDTLPQKKQFTFKNVNNERRSFYLLSTQRAQLELLPPSGDTTYNMHDETISGFLDSVTTEGLYFRVASQSRDRSSWGGLYSKEEKKFARAAAEMPVWFVPWNRIISCDTRSHIAAKVNESGLWLRGTGLLLIAAAPIIASNLLIGPFSLASYMLATSTGCVFLGVSQVMIWCSNVRHCKLCNGGRAGEWLIK